MLPGLTPPRIGHGTTPWHCACHERAFPVPSMAADCETHNQEDA